MDQRLLTYNALDATTTFEINEEFKLPPEFEDSYRFTLDVLQPLMYMMTRGIKVDHDALKGARERAQREIDDRQEELNKLTGFDFNPKSPKQCQQYFYIEKGIRPYTNKDGNITTDDKALQRIYRKTNLREAKLVQELRGLHKLKGTYLDIRFDADGRLRCSYNPRGTTSGRLSSSTTIFNTGMNNQNLPPAFKNFLICDEDQMFIELDKRQAEWVVVAYLTGDANMLRVVQEGRDPHTYTGSMMFDMSEEIVVEENKLIGHESDPATILDLRKELKMESYGMPRTMSMRQCGKKSNHGLNYDERYRTFALINEIEEREANRIIEKYHGIYPGIRVWYNKVQTQLRDNRTLTNCFGRPRIFLDRWGDQLFKAAYAYLPQSTVVDGLNRGMIDIYHDEDPEVYQFELMAQVHDSTLYQTPIRTKGVYHAVGRMYDHLSPTMSYNSREFKIATDMKIGRNWGAYHPTHNPLGMREIELGDSEDKFNSELRSIMNEWETASRLANGVPGVH